MSTPRDTVNEAVEAFRHHLAISRSPHTVEAYTTALHHFQTYCRESFADPVDMPACELKPEMVFDFVNWLQANNPVSRTTRDHYLTAITRFFRWLLLKNRASFSVAEFTRLQEELADFRGRRAQRPLPRLPAEEAVEAVIAAAYAVPLPNEPETPEGRRGTLQRLRNIALLETLRSTGARVGELVALRRGDLVRERQAAVVMGKGQKQRLVYFDERAWQAVTYYLRIRDGGSSRASLPLFVRHDRGAGSKILPISTNTVRAIIDDLCRHAGVDEALTPHLFRHRFATKVLTATSNLAATQDLLGHASPTTTRIYAKLADKDAEEAHRQARDSGRI
jgi:integrase/recombinase XerC